MNHEAINWIQKTVWSHHDEPLSIIIMKKISITFSLRSELFLRSGRLWYTYILMVSVCSLVECRTTGVPLKLFHMRESIIQWNRLLFNCPSPIDSLLTMDIVFLYETSKYPLLLSTFVCIVFQVPCTCIAELYLCGTMVMTNEFTLPVTYLLRLTIACGCPIAYFLTFKVVS